MKNFPLFPRPVSWLSAVLLYVFLGLWTTFVITVLPRTIEIGHESPRLAALAYLALLLSPVAVVGLGHHLVHALLDRADPTSRVARGLFPGLGSLWAGVHGWFVIVLTSSVSLLVLVAMFPPPVHDPDSLLLTFAWPFDGRARAGAHTLVWVLVAAQLYDLERAVKERARRGEV